MRKGPTAQVAVEARSVAVARGRQVVLEVARLDIAAGITSIIGPNGSGKTTLLHAIAGLLPVERGQLSVLGGAPQAARKRIAYVLQAQTAPADLPVTVREIVALGQSSAPWPHPAVAGGRSRGGRRSHRKSRPDPTRAATSHRAVRR